MYERWISTSEAASLLHLSGRQVRLLAEKGVLKKSYRYTPTSPWLHNRAELKELRRKMRNAEYELLGDLAVPG